MEIDNVIMSSGALLLQEYKLMLTWTDHKLVGPIALLYCLIGTWEMYFYVGSNFQVPFGYMLQDTTNVLSLLKLLTFSPFPFDFPESLLYIFSGHDYKKVDIIT